ncbi:MAG: 16S rRNA (cytidine(1402)-2'-O)-methyltransferase [Pseudomonadota bacterium]|nr:16S rRNA (cytidine(1402)-2'-O)-methyltransferase [Pseudomonadota bacterium]
MNGSGVLYVVATPIGNLADVTERALRVLAEVAVIAAEDTRHTRRLLAHYGISAKLLSCHDHNEAEATPRVLELLAKGKDVALVSDAGTPLISDPGFSLVQAARARGLRVVPVPGANAALCALCAAGLPCDRFLFLGFPPRGEAKRREWIRSVAVEPGTLILYESGNRVVTTLQDLSAVLGGGRRAVVARELTKRFETFLDGTLEELASRAGGNPDQRKGELVILIEGNRGPAGDAQTKEEERVLGALVAELPMKQAAALAARITGGKKNRLYKLALQWQEEGTAGPGP